MSYSQLPSETRQEILKYLPYKQSVKEATTIDRRSMHAVTPGFRYRQALKSGKPPLEVAIDEQDKILFDYVVADPKRYTATDVINVLYNRSYPVLKPVLERLIAVAPKTQEELDITKLNRNLRIYSSVNYPNNHLQFVITRLIRDAILYKDLTGFRTLLATYNEWTNSVLYKEIDSVDFLLNVLQLDAVRYKLALAIKFVDTFSNFITLEDGQALLSVIPDKDRQILRNFLLSQAIIQDNEEATTFYLQQGADPNTFTMFGRERMPMLALAVHVHNQNITEALVNAGADINHSAVQMSALHELLLQRRPLEAQIHAQTALFLLRRGMDIEYARADPHSWVRLCKRIQDTCHVTVPYDISRDDFEQLLQTSIVPCSLGQPQVGGRKRTQKRTTRNRRRRSDRRMH